MLLQILCQSNGWDLVLFKESLYVGGLRANDQWHKMYLGWRLEDKVKWNGINIKETPY